MRVFKNKIFTRWAKKLLTDESLLVAAEEIAAGDVEGDLGKKVFKKRIALPGGGKSGGVRTIVAFQKGDNTFFMYGFEKNKRANIKNDELEGLQKLAKKYFSYTDEELDIAVETKALVEIER